MSVAKGMMMNENIIPYVPIAPRVQATNEKSRLLCEQLFLLIDSVTSSQILLTTRLIRDSYQFPPIKLMI